MTSIQVGPAYADFRNKHAEVLASYQRKIDKTVDLFSRIKSTEQAEEVTTVLFAARQLKQSRNDTEVSEQDLYSYILHWKKSWNKDEKRTAIGEAIRNLEMLSWMRLCYSEALTTK